ncbi:sodium:solute symporter [Lewinella cohaerens]|uniref:sodium:solute symporter n=1 Tax=Lewinella cohaerens TaxID=70995 RepID=UPI000374E123|nr:sodium:solute symporter [Lewinella cohaerens]
MSTTLTITDFLVIIVYFVGIIVYGISQSKRATSEEYFLGGRSLTWPVVGISLFAANISSSTLIGLAGSAYLLDMTVYNYEWYAVLVLVFFAIFFLPFYLKSGVYTMPEFMEKRYDARSRYYFSFITVVGNVLIDTAASLYVGTIVLGLIFPSVDTWIIIVLLAAAAAAYTIPGGLNSVVKTEVIQAIVLVFGSIILTYYGLKEVGGWDGMITQLNDLNAAGVIDKNADQALSIVRENEGDWWRQYDSPIVPWWGLITGVPLLGFYFWANNQFMVQRILSSKSINHGRWGALFAGLLKLPVILIMVIPGTIAFLIFRDADIAYQTFNGPCEDLANCTNYTYPSLLFKLLPTGLLGLVVAGLLAAMMSSISATFNSASTLITMDFVNKLRPNMTSKELVRAGQIATLILVVLASLWAPQIEKFGDLFKYLQDVLGYIAPPVVSAFLLGLFWKRASSDGSFYSLIFGLIVAAIWVVGIFFEVDHWFFQMHFLLRTTVLFFLCLFVHIGVSLASTAPTTAKLEGMIWTKSLIAEETEELRELPWYQNYRYQAVVLLIITAFVVGYFW